MHKSIPLIAAALACLATGASKAQSPYAGQQARPIKALSDQQVADLKAGRGMGMALPAELQRLSRPDACAGTGRPARPQRRRSAPPCSHKVQRR